MKKPRVNEWIKKTGILSYALPTRDSLSVHKYQRPESEKVENDNVCK